MKLFNVFIIKKYMYFYSVYSLCFSIDGLQLLATAGHDILVYRSVDGYLLNTLKGN